MCDQLEQAVTDEEVEPFLDALLIDDGQDLPPAFYRLAMKALRPPHRLYWAYDEAQGIGNLIVPRAAEVFGQSEDGRPVVDLAGNYPSGIQKAHNLNRCYRTPADVLRTAHAFNMGLLRAGGPLQGVTTQQEWALLGYEVDGEFSQAAVAAGQTVRLRRAPDASGHPYEDAAFTAALRPDQPLETIARESKEEILDYLRTSVKSDLASGLEPGDVLITLLPGCGLAPKEVANSLTEADIAAFEAGTDAQRAVFRDEQRVTVATIFRTKGNEAWKVYAVGLHAADTDRCKDSDDELVRRNQVFTALTRARGWCVALGLAGPSMSELSTLSTSETIEFPAFNQRSLKRHIEHTEGPQADFFS